VPVWQEDGKNPYPVHDYGMKLLMLVSRYKKIMPVASYLIGTSDF